MTLTTQIFALLFSVITLGFSLYVLNKLSELHRALQTRFEKIEDRLARLEKRSGL